MHNEATLKVGGSGGNHSQGLFEIGKDQECDPTLCQTPENHLARKIRSHKSILRRSCFCCIASILIVHATMSVSPEELTALQEQVQQMESDMNTFWLLLAGIVVFASRVLPGGGWLVVHGQRSEHPDEEPPRRVHGLHRLLARRLRLRLRNHHLSRVHRPGRGRLRSRELKTSDSCICTYCGDEGQPVTRA